ncbi:T9SS type A sorting domain-containing protein [Flavobacterium croceum]|uniref:T9SS type A sorting domain-containing protein n=1 Tax=Flavobacterium croceum TaxID=370975 RepID=UPI0024A8603B|nr:T9SS type A sorting domain-containing protein [Flavobacterium croceum]
MKKLVLIFTIIYCHTVGAQQFYQHYLDQTCEWRSASFGGGEFESESVYRTIFFDGTEDYAGYTYYRERFFTVIKHYSIFDGSFLYQEEYYPTVYNLIREDASGKFYRRIYNNITVEQMYQDNALVAAAQIGDNFPPLPFYNFGVCPVQSIEYIPIAGLNLKWLKGYNIVFSAGMVEGIGPIAQACGNDSGGLFCFTKQGETQLFLPGLSCNEFPEPVRLGSTNFTKNSITVFPNPTTGIVTIDTTYNNLQLILYNTQGQQLLTTNAKNIDLAPFPSGIYFIQIKTNTTTQIQKIIKN